MTCPDVIAEKTKAQKNEVLCSRLHQLNVELGLKPRSVHYKSHALGIAEMTWAQGVFLLDKHLQNDERKLMVLP